MTAYDTIREKYDAVLAAQAAISEGDRTNHEAPSKLALYDAVDDMLMVALTNFLPDYTDPVIAELVTNAGQPTLPATDDATSLEDMVPAMVPVRLMRVLISVHKIPVFIPKMKQFGNFSVVYSPLLFGATATDASGKVIDKIAKANAVIARLKSGDFSPFVDPDEENDD